MSIGKAMWLGIQLGAGIGGFFAVVALVVALLQGSTELQFRGDANVNALLLAAVYLFGGMTAGMIGGLLHRLARWTMGAALVGIVAALPICTGVTISLEGLSPWTGGHTFLVVTLSVVMGGFLGVMYSKMLRDP